MRSRNGRRWRAGTAIGGALCLAAMPVAAADEPRFPRDPDAAVIVTEDIPRFWRAFDAAGPDLAAQAFEEHYLRPGSPGVEGFTPLRIRSAEHLAKVVRAHRRYYASTREISGRVADLEAPIRDALRRLATLYPEAIFPPVYFVVGALNSGGTTSPDGLIIGVEMYGLTPDSPLEELGDWERTVIAPLDRLPHIVAHELIHYQQRYEAATLLEKSLQEGSADFLAEMISGRHINDHVHEWARPREAELKEEFRRRLDDTSLDGWLYGSSPGRPNDLGYWIGYEITRRYYERAADRSAAIRDILTIPDPHAFVERSGYLAPAAGR